jgi:hypothetical protein
MTEQEAIAGIDVGVCIRTSRHAVEHGHRGHVSAIDRIDDDTAARLRSYRLQQMELCAMFYESALVLRREL